MLRESTSRGGIHYSPAFAKPVVGYTRTVSSLVFKIMPVKLWQTHLSRNDVPWAPIDNDDGYIHLSTAAQLQETAKKHFGNKIHLVLLWIDPTKICDLRWEPSRGGDLFPHVYGQLTLDAVARVTNFVGETPGTFNWPELE